MTRFMKAAGAALVAAAVTGPSWGQSYPTRPIRMLIPQPVGGTMETIARGVIDIVVPSLGQNVVIDNRSGANGVIAGETLARAVPDGYTLLYTSASLANNEVARTDLPFQILRDFAPVILINKLPGYLVLVNPTLPVKNIKDLIALSKDPKKPVHFGSGGVGNSQHLLGELLNARTGSNLQHVPYKGFALIVTAVMGNEIQVAFGAPTTVTSHIQSGRMRAIAYTGEKRFAGMPAVPTISESGYPGFVYAASWHGMFAPAKTPRPIVMRLHSEFAKAVHSERAVKLMAAGGHQPMGSTPEEFTAYLRQYLKETEEQMRIAKIEKQSGTVGGGG